MIPRTALVSASLARSVSCASVQRCISSAPPCSRTASREQVQNLLGHADARTTDLYNRTKKEVSRNIVERISI
jgi:hypothetical protein